MHVCTARPLGRLVLTLLISGTLAAQQDTAKAPAYGWKHTSVGTLTLTQVAFTDWTQGGENALSWALGLDGKSVLEREQTSWSTSYKFGFGQARLGDQGIRKTDDQIDLETMLTYKLGGQVNPYGAATLKTQFAKGFKYDAKGTETEVSQIFDPAYLTQTVGAVYQPIPELKTRLGVGLREIFTSKFPRYADDPSTLEIEKTQVNGGLESVTELSWKIEDNVTFGSKLEMFSTFKKLDEVIVRSDNILAAKVSKYITAMLTVQLLNERAASPRTQIKEVLGLGFSYTFL
jgi:hypothetical protein